MCAHLLADPGGGDGDTLALLLLLPWLDGHLGHKNPAGSRAIAAATMRLTCLRAARTRNRAHRHCWAAHARAATCGGRPCWRRAIVTPTAGRCFKAQADPGQLRAQVRVASLGRPPTMHLRAAGAARL